ncbi:putative ABC transport system substrate-binding protein [Bradyrhizobium sp. USDA 4354]
MRRREFLGVLGGSAAWPLVVRAQQRSTPVIGILGFGATIQAAPGVAAFRQGLREVGYAEGRNVVIEYRWAEGKPERFPALAAELVAQKVDVIFSAGGTLATLAAMRATSSIPVVFGVVGNPVEEGVVTNLARPNGNATGLSYVFDDLLGKWLELARQVAPRASLIAVLSKTDATSKDAWEVRQKRLTTLGQTLGVQVQVVAAQGPAEFDRAFSEISAKSAGALVVLQTPTFDAERQRIVDLAADRRLPTVYSDRTYVDSGGLVSYGPNLADLHRRAATYVDKILKGAKPSDLPVEQPTKFDLIINLKTAKTLGLAIPPSLLATAFEVIE